MLLIVLGVAFDGVALQRASRSMDRGGAGDGLFSFSFGRDSADRQPGAGFASALAIFGSAMVTIALVAVVWGFWRTA